MTILLDNFGHLVSDASLDELHEFARRIRLPRSWFQGAPMHAHPHYDLMVQWRRDWALRAGATFVSGREAVQRMVRS